MKSTRLHFTSCLVLTLVALAAALGQTSPQDGGRRGGGGGAMGGFFGSGSGGFHGSVTAISGNEVTVKNEQGETYKIETGPNTHLMKDRQPIKISDIHVGDVVAAGGEVDEKAHTVGAVFLAVLDAEQVQRIKQAQADFGKTWTAGKVTAINELVLTVERLDKKTQTITVDENTSFHKHRDSITLADIKVGDSVTARGALKDGNFTATNLAVIEPGQRGGGPRNGTPSSEPSSAPQP